MRQRATTRRAVVPWIVIRWNRGESAFLGGIFADRRPCATIAGELESFRRADIGTDQT
jgi:hypothetical protein